MSDLDAMKDMLGRAAVGYTERRYELNYHPTVTSGDMRHVGTYLWMPSGRTNDYGVAVHFDLSGALRPEEWFYGEEAVRQ